RRRARAYQCAHTCQRLGHDPPGREQRLHVLARADRHQVVGGGVLVGGGGVVLVGGGFVPDVPPLEPPPEKPPLPPPLPDEPLPCVFFVVVVVMVGRLNCDVNGRYCTGFSGVVSHGTAGNLPGSFVNAAAANRRQIVAG